ncbi:Uncharacterised protein [Mycobacteroides abscessus subsp. abscessus]|nr:Uncharacterised protein [Mycobacteroides abscessus subsp. abscessus]
MLLVVAVLLLWFATVLQTYLGLTGEIKAAHAVVTPVDGADHQLEVDLTLYGDEDTPERRETFRVQGDLWVLQANIVELEPWVNALGFHGEDRDFFEDMRDGAWWTDPFVRSAYGNAVIATPGEYDVYISRDAIKTRPVNT